MGAAHALEAVGAIQDGGEPFQLGTLPKNFSDGIIYVAREAKKLAPAAERQPTASA